MKQEEKDCIVLINYDIAEKKICVEIKVILSLAV